MGSRTKVATRKAIQAALDATSELLPGLVSGSADLTGNTGTKVASFSGQSAQNLDGRQMYYGIREHGMGSAMVGMALHGGVLPVGGTFFVFVDYMPSTGPARSALGCPGGVRLHPRFGGCWRGRPYTSTGRTACRFAGDARPPCGAPS